MVRKRANAGGDTASAPESVQEVNKQYDTSASLSSGGTEKPAAAAAGDGALTTNTFWLTRVIFIRALAFIYCEFSSS